MNDRSKDSRRGVALVVDEIVGYDWFRTRIRARAVFIGDDRSIGRFSGMQLKLNPQRLGAFTMQQLIIQVERNEPIFLVCYGKRWRVGDAIPISEIVYRYEP
ncbi:MAG: hypothetical protein AAF941_04975 [Pseudomonadota bacterium]